MAGIWNEVGYSARGRLPLTNRLFAGQFQTGKVNVFMRPGNYTNINIINGGYDAYPPPPPPDNGGSGLLGWITGLSIGGGFLSALGNIITAWGGSSGGSVEGRGSTKETETTVTDTEKEQLALLTQTFKDSCKINGKNGKYFVTDKNTSEVQRFTDLDELENYLMETYGSKSKKIDDTPKPTTVGQPEVQQQTVEQPTVQTKTDVLAELNKTFPDLTQKMLDGLDGVEFKDGKYFKNGNELTPDDIYEALTGNKPINKNFDLSNLQGQFLGVYDDGINAKTGKPIGDFSTARFESINSDGTVTLGGRKYEIVSQDENYMYLKDKQTDGKNNPQIYTLELNGNKYELHQRDFMGSKNAGLGIPAKTNNLSYWELT